jgi:hypothetical protein
MNVKGGRRGMKILKGIFLIFLLTIPKGQVQSFQGNENLPFVCGDINGDGKVNPADLSYFVNYLRYMGPAPKNLRTSDVNGSGSVDFADLAYLVNYFFYGGPELQCDLGF